MHGLGGVYSNSSGKRDDDVVHNKIVFFFQILNFEMYRQKHAILAKNTRVVVNPRTFPLIIGNYFYPPL